MSLAAIYHASNKNKNKKNLLRLKMNFFLQERKMGK